MKKITALFLMFSTAMFAYTLSPADSNEIADKIWKNECGGTISGLTHWGKGEGFGSFGIGHFIWYAEGKKERFEETFPALIAFLQKEKASIPLWLQNRPACPWSTREEFYQEIDSPKMIALRQMLLATRGLQAAFIVDRFKTALIQLKGQDDILQKVESLTSSKKGTYALIDYLNFKGSGLSSSETYLGQGWGLLQVLTAMDCSKDPTEAFVLSAKEVLSKRIKNAPSEREEEKWLAGWYHRVESYLE